MKHSSWSKRLAAGQLRWLVLGLAAILALLAVLAANKVLAANVKANDGAKGTSRPDGIQIMSDEEEPTISEVGRSVSALTGAPLALYGVNYRVIPGSPEAMARQYLRENAAVLHLRRADLSDLSHRVTSEGPAGVTVRFTQDVGGVPVYAGEIAVHINNDFQVTYVTNGYRPLVAISDLVPSLTAAEARGLAYDYLAVQGPLDFDQVRLVVYTNRAVTRLAYEVRVVPRSPLGDWEVLVDAETSELFKVLNTATDLDGDGNVFDPDPLSSANATYGQPGYVDGNDANTPELLAQQFNVTLKDIQFSGGMYWLIGPYAEIQDFENPFKGLFEQASSTFNFNRFDDAFEAVNTYYHIDSSMRYLSETLGIPLLPTFYSGGVRFDPHGLSGADNSHYIPSLDRLAFGEGGVDDAEDSDVIHHELGHGLHDWATNGGGSQVQGLGEGIGDFWAQSYNRGLGLWQPTDPQYNWVFNWDGHNPFWPGRVTNWPNLYPGGLTGDIHTDGQIWATTMMRIWDAIGKTKTDTAHWEGIGMTGGSTNQQQAANAVLQAAIDLGYSQADLIAMRNEFLATGYTMAPLPIPDFGLNGTPANATICAGDPAVYAIGVTSQLGYSGVVTLSASGEPAGTTTDFSPNGNAAPYTSTLTISNTTGAAVGSYTLLVTGVSPTATHTTTVALDVTTIPSAIVLLSPVDGSPAEPTFPMFTWQADPLATSYTLEVATDVGFGNIVLSASGLTGTSYTPGTALDPNTTYYWRVRGSGPCGEGSNGTPFSFTTVAPVFMPYVSRP